MIIAYNFSPRCQENMAAPPTEAAHEGPSFAEAKQYVRQQLSAMGVSWLPEHQLETYTRGNKGRREKDFINVIYLRFVTEEFLRLVGEREDSITSRDTSTCSSSTEHRVFSACLLDH